MSRASVVFEHTINSYLHYRYIIEAIGFPKKNASSYRTGQSKFASQITSFCL